MRFSTNRQELIFDSLFDVSSCFLKIYDVGYVSRKNKKRDNCLEPIVDTSLVSAFNFSM